VRAPDGERVQALLGAPGQVAAQVRFGVVAGGAHEPGEVSGRCQLQPLSERLWRIGGRESQLGEGRHAMTLKQFTVTVKLTNTYLVA
jgi:hypothetical protein